MHFGSIDKTDFLIPPFALFYFYTVFAAAFDLPIVSTQRFCHSEVISWVGVFLCFGGLILLLLSLVSFGKSFRVGIDIDHPDKLVTTGVFAFSRNPIYESSFRLNHRLPWCETHPKVMQRTANFHHQIADARLPEAVGVVHDTTALDAAVDVLDTHATARDAPIGGFLRPCESPAPRLLGGHDDLDVVKREGQEAEVLEQPAACRQGVRRGICNPFVVRAARIGVTQEEDRQGRIDQQHIFHGMAFFLATITARLLKRVLGALDPSFRPIMAERGERVAGVGAAVGGSTGGDGSSGGTTRAAASASATPIRWVNACKDLLGASPRVRSVACSTTSST